LATVIADTFDDSRGAGVADAEALTDDAADEQLTARRPISDDVAGDDVFFGHERRPPIGMDADSPAAQTLADVVVGVALESQLDARGDEGTEALPGRAAQTDL